ncbi:hypothetical protein [Streptomyces sp. NPDC094472]|uniref:hypothetical protein n=1 Tax=Streptomyces sp. NPDC094472 TaxID=3155080 RepID=UPI0033301A53
MLDTRWPRMLPQVGSGEAILERYGHPPRVPTRSVTCTDEVSGKGSALRDTELVPEHQDLDIFRRTQGTSAAAGFE